MRIHMAIEPEYPGKLNEDFIGSTPSGVVLVDGAGLSEPFPGCSHGVAWFARHLGGNLLALIEDHSRDLVSVLATAITTTASLHATCDLADPSAPFGAVAMLRFTETGVDYLAISDAVLLVLDGDSVEVIRDGREFEFGRDERARVAKMTPGTPEYDEAFAAAVQVVRGHRNQPHGYWLAAANPEAASHALTGHVPGARSAVVLSNGASRLVDRFGLATWPELIALVSSQGPAELIRRVRAAEAESGTRADDATAAVVRWTGQPV
jgi:hypothetical protein